MRRINRDNGGNIIIDAMYTVSNSIFILNGVSKRIEHLVLL